MDTTTPDGGDANASQPTTTEAVTTGHNADQVITTDESGTPTMVPATSQSDDAPAVSEDEAPNGDQPKETQAPEADDTVAWAKKKGLDINPDNPNEVKLANMQREAERKMHQATQKSSVQPPELLTESEDPAYNQVIERQNQTDLKLYVRDWFDANSDMKEHRAELQRIANERPWLQDMDDVKAHFLANPSREMQLKNDGGREALTNLAQKQSQIPPGANATNSGVYDSQSTITPKNVFEQIDKHDQAWFEKNHEAINKAISGK